MDEVIYTLKDGFEYASKGQVENAQFITLLSPSAKYIEHIAPLKAYVLTAITWAQNQDSDKNKKEDQESSSEEEEEDKDIPPEMLMTILDLTPEVDMVKLLLHVNAMLTSGLAKIDGEVRYTKLVSDKLSISDCYGLAGCFLVNFIVPSLS